MIETANPEINVEELMQRVRLEASKLRNVHGRSTSLSVRSRGSTLPPIRVLPPPPRPPLLKALDPKRERLDSMLREAREKSEGSPRIPKMFRRFFRKQGGYNRLLADSVALLGKTNAQLAKQLREMNAAFETQSRWLRSVAEYRQSDAAWMRAATQQISSLGNHLAELGGPAGDLKSRAARWDDVADTIETVRRENSAFAEYLRELRSQVDAIRAELQRAGGAEARHGAGR